MNGAPRARVLTVGCRLNQCEGMEIERLLQAAGYEPAASLGPADVVVVHTCCVTASADADCRSLIRKVRRSNPEARIVVSGCFAQLQPDRLAALEGVTDVVGTGGWREIGAYLQNTNGGTRQGDPSNARVSVGAPGRGPFETAQAVGPVTNRTRALMKVQDGCSRGCSFCVVPLARGPGRSLPADRVREKARYLASRGHAEIVLTGASLGTWGRDLDPPQSFEDLLAALEEDDQAPPMAGTAAPRLRLSSIDPRDLSAGLVARIARSERICPHLHVSLQSGDPGVLKAMGRGLGAERLRETLERALSEIRGLALGLDVIVGFPAENDDAFERTIALLESLGFAYLHVFRFSPRSGTAAASLPDRIPDGIVRERARRLGALSWARREEFHASRVGRQLQVLVEDGGASVPGWVRSTSREYIPVFLPQVEGRRGKEQTVIATGLRGAGLAARVVHAEE